MKIIKKTHILVETKREIIIGKSPPDEQDEQIVCEQCGGEMMTAQTVSALLGINIREIYRLIEKGKLSFFRQPIGSDAHLLQRAQPDFAKRLNSKEIIN